MKRPRKWPSTRGWRKNERRRRAARDEAARAEAARAEEARAEAEVAEGVQEASGTETVDGSQQRVEEWPVTMIRMLAELHAKVDQLSTEVKSLGRRVESWDSSIHLEKFETVQEYLAFEKEVKKSSATLKQMMSRMAQVGPRATMSRTAGAIMKRTLLPHVYNKYTMHGNTYRGITKPAFKKTWFCKAMIGAIKENQNVSPFT